MVRWRILRLHLERPPGNTPGLNPVERIGRDLSYGRMTNFAPQDPHHVDRVLVGHME